MFSALGRKHVHNHLFKKRRPPLAARGCIITKSLVCYTERKDNLKDTTLFQWGVQREIRYSVAELYLSGLKMTRLGSR